MKKYLFLAVILKFFVFVWPGVVMADTSLNGRWLDYFEEGDSVRINSGASVTTQKPQDKAGTYIKTGLWRWNLKNNALSFRVKVSDWTEAAVVTLIVGNGIKLNAAATVDIRLRFINAPNDEWVEVVVPPSAWTEENEVDWENIDMVLFTIMDSGNQRITGQIANIKAVPITAPTGVVSITVDDGEPDTMLLASVMSASGYAGTAFIDVTKVGQPGFITEQDVAALIAAGWDISGHNMGNLTKMPIAEVEQHVATTAGYLQAHNAPGADLYALPNGGRNAAVVDAVKTKFPYVFNIDGMANDRNYIIPSNINRHSIDKHTSLKMAQKWVDDAKKNGEWVIINFHTFSDNWAKEEDWTEADLRSLIDYIKSQGMEVMPVSAVLKK